MSIEGKPPTDVPRRRRASDADRVDDFYSAADQNPLRVVKMGLCGAR